MTAVPLLKGSPAAEDYEDAVAADPRIDALRAKMEVVENPAYTRDYLRPHKTVDRECDPESFSAMGA